MSCLRLILLIGVGLGSFPASADDSRSLSFVASGDRLFDFDTGVVKGRLRANGKYQGISGLVDVETGKELTRSAGIFSYYRVLSTDQLSNQRAVELQEQYTREQNDAQRRQ